MQKKIIYGKIVNSSKSKIALSKKVIEFASSYYDKIERIQHVETTGQVHYFYANNKLIAAYLKKDLTYTAFKKLFDLCKMNGVFDLSFNKHIPCVTFNAAAKHMTRKWTRDHSGMMPLIKDKYPNEEWAGLLEWCKAYDGIYEIKAFERVFKNPDCARFNHGIAHVFWQKKDGTLVRDNAWKMHQRIESHGEFLRCLANYVRQRISDIKLPKVAIRTIVRFTQYLYVLGCSPQSCGAWEEIPFSNGINWDNLSVVKSFEEVVNLILKLEEFPELHAEFIKFENEICKKFRLLPLFNSSRNLQQFIKVSLRQIRHFYLDEFRGATKRIDASSVMLAAEMVDLSSHKNLIINVKKHLRILKIFEKKLVHEFGAWRYNQFSTSVDDKKIMSCDSYLNLNYYIFCNAKGHICALKHDYDVDCNINDNKVGNFVRRAQNAKEKTSAQWGLPLSYAAIAYGKLTAMLLDEKDKKGNLPEEEKNLLLFCFNKNQEYIKRTYANISGCYPDGSLFLKADGKKIEPFRKPEAYQAVTSELNTTKYAFIPGVNDHLGWDAAKCYEASKIFLSNLKRMLPQ